MKKLLTLFALAMMMLGVQNANASVKLTALSGNNWSHGSESPKALLDEQTNSKWGTWDGKDGNTVYIIMKSSAAIAPKSYELITANDTYKNTGRSWSQWKIYGGNFTSDAEATLNASGWVLIDDKSSQSLDKGTQASPYAVNKLNISETIASGTYYTYFKIVVEAVEGGFADNYCQMDGFRFTNVKFAPQDVTFTCTAGKNYHASNGEGIDKMFDLDCNTKYCGDAGSDCYALVTASKPVFVWGYDLTTANDNNNDRKVSKWSLYGTNDADVAADPSADGWVTLSNIASNNYIEGKNWYTQRFFCNKSTIGNAYKYFKVTLDEGGFVQLSEFRFCYDTYRPIAYNFKSGPSGSESAFDGLPNTKWGGNASIFTGSENAITIETSDGNSYAVKKYHFSTDDDGSCKNRAPKSWTIEGSNDNSSWTTIAEVDDAYAIHNTNRTTYEFTPSNTTDAFRYVRLTLNSMKGTGYCQIGDFQVLNTSDVSDEDFYATKVNEAKNSEYSRGTLSETDPWYVEYKSLYDGLDALLTSCKTSGLFDPIDVAIEKMTRLVSLMDQLKATTTDYVAFDGSSCWGDGHWSQLVDGKDGIDGRESTKWGAFFGGDDAVQYVIFRRKDAIQPYFYRLVTGDDTKTNNGRNWKTWKVWGANFTSFFDAKEDAKGVANGWTLLDNREDIDETYLPMENLYPAAFNFTEGVDQEYYYYMVEVYDSHGRNYGAQMNEMYLCLQSEFEVMRAPLVAYFADFDNTTITVEADMEDELAEFNTKFAELQTTDDAVQLTLLYNQCVALRAALEESSAVVNLNNSATIADGAYQLGTAAQLDYFSKAINAGRNELNAVLTANIDMTGVTMTPIGTSDKPYKGTFDGQGKAISNFTFNNSSTDNVGLFGVTNSATIQKVILQNANVVGNANAGGLVGNAQNASTIQNCAVLGSHIEGRDHVAAIAANAVGETVISNNYSNATIKSRNYQAGGMVGTIMSATIEKNLFTGTVTCENGGDASGLVSRIDGVANPVPIVRNNMVAASTITGGNTYAIIRADWTDRPVTFADNYTLKSTVYSTGGKTLTDKDDRNGLQIDWIQATTKDFYETTLGWNFTDDWKFTCGGKYPILKIMADEALPTQNLAITAEAGYATMVAKYDYDFTGASFEAFAVTESEKESVVHLKPVSSAKHGEALLLKNENGVNFTQTATATAQTAATGNLLKASDGSVTGGEGIYALAKKVNGVGFYPVDASVTIPEGKAYLEVATNTGGGGVKAFYGFEEDDATGISLMEDGRSKMEDGAIYNLAGQRISKMQRGINIVNGKKILK